VPALAAVQAVWDLRWRHDPSAAAGIPPHVTLMFPFVPPADLTEPLVESLEALIAAANPFDFALTRVHEFEQGVVYLEPEPAGPFAQLTRDIGRRFGLLPFAGAFGERPIPHVTVAMPESGIRSPRVSDELGPYLPISLRAEAAWLMVGSNAQGWRTFREMPLGRAT
jgi:2'-5' RNA ligase